MANRDAPAGARLIGTENQATANGQIHAYTVLAADAVAIFPGDFVKLTGTLALNEDKEYFPVVAQAATTNAIVGFVTSVKYNPNNLSSIVRPANTLGTVYVMDAPGVRFAIQTDGTGAVADVGQNADIAVGTGNPLTGTSAMEIDQTSLTSSTAQLRIVDLERRADNEVGEFMEWICFINEHEYKATTGV